MYKIWQKETMHALVFLVLVLILFGCQTRKHSIYTALETQVVSLAHVPRLPAAYVQKKLIPIIPVSADMGVVLSLDASTKIDTDHGQAKFLFEDLSYQLSYWQVPNARFRPVLSENVSVSIETAVFFWAEQIMQSVRVVGELEDFLIVSASDISFGPGSLGQPVFLADGRVLGIVYSFDMDEQQIRVLKSKVMIDFWSENQ